MECIELNTRVCILISVTLITRLLLADAIISSKTDLRSGGKKEKRSYGKVRNKKTMSTIMRVPKRLFVFLQGNTKL